MTEAEWLSATDPRPMLGFMQSKLTDRKSRLFAVACCRLVSSHFSKPGSLQAIEVAERYADDASSDFELTMAWADAGPDHVSPEHSQNAVSWWADAAAEWAVEGPKEEAYWRAARTCRSVLNAKPESLQEQVHLLRCVAGNPFRPVSADHAWLTSSVVALARQMYDRRDFGPMPILADALQDAGCDHPDVLAHCRAGGPHVRGCWVVDLILGKS